MDLFCGSFLLWLMHQYVLWSCSVHSLENEERASSGGSVSTEMKIGKERLRRKLLARQKRKMLREKAHLTMSTCVGEEEKEKLQHGLEQQLQLLEQESEANKLYFSNQFKQDQDEQGARMKARLRKKHDKKMAKLLKSQEKITQLVQKDDAIGIGTENAETEILALTSKIQTLNHQSKEGQDELDALIEANAADR